MSIASLLLLAPLLVGCDVAAESGRVHLDATTLSEAEVLARARVTLDDQARWGDHPDAMFTVTAVPAGDDGRWIVLAIPPREVRASPREILVTPDGRHALVVSGR